jgi:hypothetical protein
VGWCFEREGKMDSLIFDLGVSFVLSAIKGAVKNSTKKKELKAALLKVATAIIALYPEEFLPQEVDGEQ